MKAQFKERWTKTPSATLKESIKAESAKYRQVITNAVSADKIVREWYSGHKSCIELMSESDVRIRDGLNFCFVL